MPEKLCYFYGTYFEDYLYDVEICQRFARHRREKIAEVLMDRCYIKGGDALHTIHIYIDSQEMILRKGVTAAHARDKALITISMRDGSVLAAGKGNPEWNISSPYGAGRLMFWKRARESLDMEEYREIMKGIYTTSSCETTLDEAPMAYKSLEDIIEVIRESADAIEFLKPNRNIKAD